MAEFEAQPQSAGTEGALAAWWQRGAALVVDSILPIGVLVAAVSLYGESEATTGGASVNANFSLNGAPAAVTFALVLAWGIVNWWYMQGTTGQTIGKKLLGIAVHRVGTGEPTGVPTAIGRYFARVFDVIPCYLGLLWPLWDKENRTFADMMCDTRVHRVR